MQADLGTLASHTSVMGVGTLLALCDTAGAVFREQGRSGVLLYCTVLCVYLEAHAAFEELA